MFVYLNLKLRVLINYFYILRTLELKIDVTRTQTIVTLHSMTSYFVNIEVFEINLRINYKKC